MLADRIEADLALGEGASLVGELRVLLAADPLAERPRALLMRALYAAGRQAEAIAAYHEGRELLADQLGVDPSAQLEQVYLGMLRGELPAGASRAPDQAPVPCHAPAERAAVPAQAPALRRPGAEPADQLRRPGRGRRPGAEEPARGPAGHADRPGRSGQDAAGRRGSRHGSDAAAWFVQLAPVTDPAEVPSAVLDALGIREPVIARRAAEPRRGTRWSGWPPRSPDRDDVLILDNCEHVIEAAAALAGQVLAGCPRLRILATSREPLRIDGETLWPVAAAAGPAGPRRASAAHDRLDGGIRSGCWRDRAAAVRPGLRARARPTRPRWPGSAGRSTACRWPSSWPRRGCAR